MKTRYALAVLLSAVMAGAAWSATPSSAPGKNGIYKGYRGISLSLPGYQVAFLNKGDRADVMVTFDAKMTDRKEKVTATILQNVVVVNVIHPSKLEENGVVEILVNPNEAQYTALALRQGDVHISARAEGDTEMAAMEMASFTKLFK